MTHTVSARDANQQFSKLLRQVEDGEDVVITRPGEPIARLVPVASTAQRREQAWQTIERLMSEGFDIGDEPFDRDSLHDR